MKFWLDWSEIEIKLPVLLGSIKMQRLALTAYLYIFHSKSQMPLIMKSVSLKKMNNFCIGRF
jgi:hypothetical protein